MNVQTKKTWQPRGVAAACALAGLSMLIPSLAQAHFILNQPASLSNQDLLGSPQKAYPCGLDGATPGTPTGAVTTYVAGQTINLSIKETVFHPGHYRVAIAQTPATLPADPVVTPETTPNNTPCGSVPIIANPTLPILADGIFKHTASYGTTAQTVSVKLPDGFTCNNCTLQVIQWMYNHPLNNPGGCFYHHCATVNIVASSDGGVSNPADMSTTPTSDLGDPTPIPTTTEGCSSRVGAGSASGIAPASALLLFLGLGLRRRSARRKASRV